MSISIVILAAGQGTRMKSKQAKVLHTLSGKSMLHHIVTESLKLSDDITVVTYHQADAVEASLKGCCEAVRFVRQDAQNFPGTGGAVMGVSPKHERVLILNGDMPLVRSEELSVFVDTHGDIVMGTIQMEDPSGYGRVVITDTQVEAIVEEKDATAEQKAIQHVNTGVYLLNSALLLAYLPRLTNTNAQKEFYLTDIVAIARSEGKSVTAVTVSEASFQGINSKHDLANAETLMQKRIKEEWMRQGVIMRLPETIYIESGVRFIGECEVQNGVTLKGETLIEESTVKSHSVVESATIRHSEVGPMARIRPQTVIEASKIGNFVEVKKSTLNGVKAGHLSYIGDAQISEGSNIGAGVITCNYDGIKKYPTVIGKNVFVGSDSQLIAPLTVEDDVLIAAGTTVPKGKVEKGSLAVSRPPLKRIGNFFYKFFGNNA